MVYIPLYSSLIATTRILPVFAIQQKKNELYVRTHVYTCCWRQVQATYIVNGLRVNSLEMETPLIIIHARLQHTQIKSVCVYVLVNGIQLKRIYRYIRYAAWVKRI